MFNPTFITAKPRHRRKRNSVEAPPRPVTIAGVNAGAASLFVYFSGPIVWNGIDVPSEFVAMTEEGFESPVNVLSSGEDWIEMEFNDTVAEGAAWQLVGDMAGITPAVVWPASGTVEG